MKKYLSFLTFVSCLLIMVFWVKPAWTADNYRIVLKSGETIDASHYELQGENIILYKSWGSISFNRSEVASVEKDSSSESDVDDAALQENQKTEPGKFKTRQRKPKGNRETELDKCRKQLRYARQGVKSYCSDTNSARVPRKKAKTYQTHIQNKVLDYKTQVSCNYYKDLVAELEGKCGEP